MLLKQNLQVKSFAVRSKNPNLLYYDYTFAS